LPVKHNTTYRGSFTLRRPQDTRGVAATPPFQDTLRGAPQHLMRPLEVPSIRSNTNLLVQIRRFRSFMSCLLQFLLPRTYNGRHAKDFPTPYTILSFLSLPSLHAVITRVIYTFRIDFAPAAPNALPNVCTFRSSSVPFLCFSLLCLYMTLDGSLALRVYPSLSLAPFRPFPMIPPLLSYQASHSFFSSVPHSFRVSIALLFYTTYIDRIHAL